MSGDSEDCNAGGLGLPMCKRIDCDDSNVTMVEAGAILFVVVVSIGVYLSSWFAARQYSHVNAANQLDVLTRHRETLLQKTVRGERENWDSEMMRQLAYRLSEVEREIARQRMAGRA